MNFQNNIKTCVTKAYQLQQNAKLEFENAEVLLKRIIDLDDDYLPTITCKSLTGSFKISGRLDAEYYQPKYEAIEKQIQSNNTVLNSCKVYDYNYVPLDEEFYQYIELSNVDKIGGISGVEHIAGSDLPSRARRLVKAGQVIVSSIEGSLSSCALILPEHDNAICSTGFYVVNSEKYNSETLLMLFKSAPVQAMLKKRCSGTILTAISKDEFEKMPLPDVDELVQKEIANKVRESFRLREESKRLLELAVKTVEIAIESDEESALLLLGSE